MAKDTAKERSGADFPLTRHSVVADLGDTDREVRSRAFDALVTGYWKPVYKYLRLKHGHSGELAEDLTQGFFAHVFEKGTLERFDPARARFRTWLRLCLDGYASNQHKAAGRLRRGGRFEHLPLDFHSAEGELLRIEIPVPAEVDALFDREWARNLFAMGVEDVRARYVGSDRELAWRIFERYDLEGPDLETPLRYDDLAREFDVPVTKITNSLHTVRRALRTAVLDRLRLLCSSEEEFRDEARELLGGDAP